MYNETKQIDKIEIINGNIIHVREATIITKDNVEIAKAYHRWSFAPGSDVSAMPRSVQDIAALVWTPEVLAEYKAKMAEVI